MIFNLIKSLRSKLSQTGPLYAASSVWASVLSMVSGIIMIRWLNPADLGLWQSVSVIQPYLMFLEMGLPNGLNRELPFLYGQRKVDQALILARTGLFYSIGLVVLTLVLTFIATFYFIIMGAELDFIKAVVAVGAILTVSAYQRYITVTFRSAQAFRQLAFIQFVKGGAVVGLLPLVYFLQYEGLLLYQVGTVSFFAFLMHIFRPIKTRPVFSVEAFKLLAKTGFPVFIMGYIRGINKSFNRVIILMLANTVMVGLFTPVMAIRKVNMLPGVLANYYFPKMNIKLGETGNEQSLWPMVVRLNSLLFLLGIPMAIGVWFLMPYVMPLMFPAYVSSTKAVQIMSISFLFTGTLVSHNVIYAVKNYKAGFLYVLLEGGLLFSIPFFLAKSKQFLLLESIALGVVIAEGILFIANIMLIRYVLNKNTLRVDSN